ncbi:tRNA (adenosine(37)-N6)-threonylcarbamoyltransferase complex ATPase subunit type 1 TsaE [Mariniflexile sp.]|uniref:tRNA (adenosine(37)-N6)-threonylcarbamoyltransferase complex ATPase subunit type 1 TsaE n=1 Tax=Mariniflexile sp. TaxID=1979402 RepID=UPI00356A1A10
MLIKFVKLEVNYQLFEVKEVAKQLLRNFKTKTILLIGDMGVGKTTLIKSLVKELGSTDEVSSPTFSIVNEYELQNDKIFHFDLYRLKNIEEAYNFGIEDYLDSEHWVLIEWPEIIESLLNSDYDVVNLEIDSAEKRKLTLKININE